MLGGAAPQDYRLVLGSYLSSNSTEPDTFLVKEYSKFTYRESANRAGGWILEMDYDEDIETLFKQANFERGASPFEGEWAGLGLINLRTATLDFWGPKYTGGDASWNTRTQTDRTDKLVIKGTDGKGALLGSRLVIPHDLNSHWGQGQLYVSTGPTTYAPGAYETSIPLLADQLIRSQISDEAFFGTTAYPDAETSRRFIGATFAAPETDPSAGTAEVAIRYASLLEGVRQVLESQEGAPYFHVTCEPTNAGGFFTGYEVGIKRFVDNGAVVRVRDGAVRSLTNEDITRVKTYPIILGNGSGVARTIETMENLGMSGRPYDYSRREYVIDLGSSNPDLSNAALIDLITADIEGVRNSQQVSLSPLQNDLKVGELVSVVNGLDVSVLPVTEVTTVFENNTITRDVILGGTGDDSPLTSDAELIGYE